MALLEAIGLERTFGSLKVLKGIDFSVEKGEVVSITGPSGAGKSTLLYILGSLDSPDKGTVSLSGSQITGLKGNDLAKFRNTKMGFVFQFHNLLPELTAIENICLPAWIGGKNQEEARKQARALLDFLGLKDRDNHLPSAMSGGEQQRVAVARALINQPEIVFADEPSGNLDTHNAKNLHNLFFDLRKEFGQTFVIVTHNPELAEMADREVKLADGKILEIIYPNGSSING